MSDDPDLLGDETFKPLPPTVGVEARMMCASCPPSGPCSACGGPRSAIAMAMTVSPEAQAAIHHNRLRYAELAALRLGQPNRYAETRYRH